MKKVMLFLLLLLATGASAQQPTWCSPEGGSPTLLARRSTHGCATAADSTLDRNLRVALAPVALGGNANAAYTLRHRASTD